MDLAGVVYSGEACLPGALDAIARLRAAGLPYRFITNTTSKPLRAVLAQLRGFGLDVAPGHVFSPARAACDWMAAQGNRPHLLVHEALVEDFAGCAATGPVAVVVGDARQGFTYDAMNAAFRALAAGAPFLALAENRVFQDDDGKLSIDAGAFVKALEYAAEVEPLVMGKPAPALFAAAGDSLGLPAREIAMIGDDAEADVAGALRAGLGMGVLVQTGKYRAGDEARMGRGAQLVPDLAAAVDLVLHEAG